MKKILFASLPIIILSICILSSCGNKNESLPYGEDKNSNEVAYSFMQKQKELDRYEIVTSGKTVAKTIINYIQNINNVTVKSGDIYCSESNSLSMFAKVNHKMATKNENVAYSNSDGEIKIVSDTEYKNIYGCSPSDEAIGGFIFNEETILSSELFSQGDGTSTYRYLLDTEKSAENMKKQMKEFGDLKDYPVFSSIEIYLTVKDDMTPVSYKIEAEYKINIAIFGKIDCGQSLYAEFKIGEDMQNAGLITFADALKN